MFATPTPTLRMPMPATSRPAHCRPKRRAIARPTPHSTTPRMSVGMRSAPSAASFVLVLPGPTPLADGEPSLPGHTCRHSARRDSDDHAYLTYSPRHRFEHSRVNQAHPDERYGQHRRLERAERRPPTGPP